MREDTQHARRRCSRTLSALYQTVVKNRCFIRLESRLFRTLFASRQLSCNLTKLFCSLESNICIIRHYDLMIFIESIQCFFLLHSCPVSGDNCATTAENARSTDTGSMLQIWKSRPGCCHSSKSVGPEVKDVKEFFLLTQNSDSFTYCSQNKEDLNLPFNTAGWKYR